MLTGDSNSRAGSASSATTRGARTKPASKVLKAQNLHASHHGSRTFVKDAKDDPEPYLEAFELIDSEDVIISVCPDSKHDHPHEDMLDIYNDQVGAENVQQTCVEGVCASKSCSLRGHVHPSCRSDVRAIQPGVACGLCRNTYGAGTVGRRPRRRHIHRGLLERSSRLATLSRAGRLRPEFYDQRMAMLVDQFSRAP